MARGERLFPFRLHSPLRRFPALARWCSCLVVGAILGVLAAAPAAALAPRPAPGRVLLQLRPDVAVRGIQQIAGQPPRTQIPGLDALAARFAVQRFVALFPGPQPRKSGPPGPDFSRFFAVDFPPEIDLATVRAAYAALPEVAVAEYDWICPLDLEVNDSSAQWQIESTTGMDAHITGGWNHSVGDTNVTLAIVDSGVDWMHPDLGGSPPGYTDGNIRINWAEYNGTPGVDDDNNGYVDDIHGWDFVRSFQGAVGWPGEDAGLEDPDPRDFNGHGTHVAGIAAARTNNGLGVAGVGYNCKILPLRIGGSIRIIEANGDTTEAGVVWMSYAAQAIHYATLMGAVAVNCSWSSSVTLALQLVLSEATSQGVIVVDAAGNDNTSDLGENYLASRGDCVDVAATTMADTKAAFSNYGPWVDIAAPGVNIWSTYFDHTATGSRQHSYTTLQGTSMAAPIVTGLVGLLRAKWPNLTGPTIRFLLRNGADPLDATDPDYAAQLGGGRVNALRLFDDRFLTVPDDYPTVTKAFVASGVGDTIATRGSTTITTPLLMSRSGRFLLGGWDDGFTRRDPDHPTTVTVTGDGPALEIAAGVDSTLVLEDLRFTGGVARNLATPSGRFGGGVLCLNASPTLRRCRFEGNRAGSDFEFGGGGGGFFLNSTCRLVECVFRSNQARHGGGLYLQGSQLRLEECVIDSNTVHAAVDSRGAGLYVTGGNTTLVGGHCRSNLQANQGGGVYATGATLAVRNTEISANQALRGGGIYADASTLALTATLLRANVAGQLGGGIYASASRADIANTTLDANTGGVGGILAQNAPSPWALRNDIVSNHAGAGVFFSGTPGGLDYNLYWNNAGGDLAGAGMGTHDVQADPLFVNQPAGDLALGLHSPALDSGDPAAAAADADGSRNDRGAFGGPYGRSRAPRPPQGLQARHLGAASEVGNEIAWTANPELDVQFYGVYCDSDSAFAPSAASFVGSSPADSLHFVDPGGTAGRWYRIAAVDSSGASSGFSAAAEAVPPNGIEDPPGTDGPPGAARRFALNRNAPNPFNPSTRIPFELPYAAQVRLEIVDATGRVVRRLVDRQLPAGRGAVFWDGRDGRGRGVPSGIYVVRMRADRWGAARKITLVR